MFPRFGIKIGNSTLCISFVRSDGKVEVIANKQGDRTSQACLLWDAEHEIECGLTAKQKMALRPKQAVANSFQLLQYMNEGNNNNNNNNNNNTNTTNTVPSEVLQSIPCDYNKKEHTFELRYGNPADDEQEAKVKSITWHEVHRELLKAELDLARQVHHEEDKPIVVLTIPAYYPKHACRILSETAEAAGFHVAQVIIEPVAALLAYNLIPQEKTLTNNSKKILTIKSGGLFSHFGLYEEIDGFIAEVATYGPFNIGGQNYTEALVEFICTEFQRKYKLDAKESRRSMAKIRTAAANCKHILTALPSTQIYIDSLMDGLDFNMQMSRARFESLIQPVIMQFMQTLQQSLNEQPNIDSIVLLGATMQIPKLQAAIASLYPQAQLHASIPSDEVVAVGSARQAYFLAQPETQELEQDIELRFTNEQVSIWHGEDESRSQLLLKKGALVPQRVIVKVPVSAAHSGEGLFKLRIGDLPPLETAIPKDTLSATDNCYLLQADIEYENEEDEMPVTRLRCIGALK